MSDVICRGCGDPVKPDTVCERCGMLWAHNKPQDNPWRPASEKPRTKNDLLVVNESAEGVHDLCFGYYDPFSEMWSVKVHGKVLYTVYPICWTRIPDGWQSYCEKSDEQEYVEDE